MNHLIHATGPTYTPATRPFPVALLEVSTKSGPRRYLSRCKDWEDAQGQAGEELTHRILRGQLRDMSAAIVSIHLDGSQIAALKIV